jgi:hypothetical protein
MPTTHRTFRCTDEVWLPAKRAAEQRGETITDVLVRALKEYATAKRES